MEDIDEFFEMKEFLGNSHRCARCGYSDLSTSDKCSRCGFTCLLPVEDHKAQPVAKDDVILVMLTIRPDGTYEFNSPNSSSTKD